MVHCTSCGPSTPANTPPAITHDTALGRNAALAIEPVAKITAELAPVKACAAASRATLDRARASPEMSSTAVVSIIGYFRQARPVAFGRADSRYYEGSQQLNQPTQTGARHA